MVPGRGLYTPVVFTLEDLKAVCDERAGGKIGMWAFHFEYHEGHLHCSNVVNEGSDFVIGILWNNYGAGIKWMIGEVDDEDVPIRPRDIDLLKKHSDVVMIFTGDYHPFKEHWPYLKKEFDNYFTKDFLISEGLEVTTSYAALLYSVTARILMHEIYKIPTNYHPTCGRNAWRHIYSHWLKKRFNIDHTLDDAVRDKYGNIISSSRNRIPSKYTDRIRKPLILPHFESLEEVNEHIKDIKELKAEAFAKRHGWINVKFKFADNNKYYWAEGLKLWK
jgi:hypothetical protein